MTLTETLNEHACSCGLEEGRTFFTDSNGNEVDVIGNYRLLKDSNGVSVEREGFGWCVAAVGPDEKQHVSFFTSDYTWSDTVDA